MNQLAVRGYFWLSVFALVFGLVVSLSSLTWINQPFAGFRHSPLDIVSSGDLPWWNGNQKGLSPDDQLVRVDGTPLSSLHDLRERVKAAPPGTVFAYDALREDHPFRADVPSQTFGWSDYLFTHPPYLLLGFAYLALGAIPFWMRRKDRGAAVHLGWTAAVALCLFCSLDVDFSQTAPVLYYMSIVFSAAASWHIAMVFPVPFRWVERHPMVLRGPYLALSAIALAGGAFALVAMAGYRTDWAPVLIGLNHVELLLAALGILAFLVSMGLKLFVLPQAVQRQQSAIVLAGGLLSFLPLILLWIVPFALGKVDPMAGLWYNTAILAFAFFPASIAFAIFKFSLFDISVVIKRTLTYALSTSVALVAYFLLTAGLKSLFLHLGSQSHGGLSEAISTAAIALAFAPLRDRTRALLDRLFDRTRYDFRHIVSSFTAQARETVEVSSLAQAFAAAVDEAIKPRHMAIFLADGDRHEPILASGMSATQVATFDPATPGEGALLVPLQAGEGAVGFVLLGPKKSDQAYFPQDHQLLDSLSQALALSVSNAKLFAQLAGQERLKRELEIATDMQMGFLPKKPPEFHGALVSASCTPALEVGGDFYDYIQIDPYRWGVIVGDVAGKGVPAALMMAASLTIFRAVAPSVPSPASTLARMNKLINRNRPSNKVFVTAIYLIYDCRDGSVLIANAGQPKPLLNGQPVEIKGMPLGANFRMTYKETKVVLGAHDTLVAYSDGMEDVESESGEQFGLVRVQNLFKELASVSPEDSRERVLEQLAGFSGRAAAADDLTMVMLQRQADVEPLVVKARTEPMAKRRDRADTKPLDGPSTKPTGPLAAPDTTPMAEPR